MDIERFRELPLMGILRGVKEGSMEPLAECLVSSGLRTVEIAMNTPGAPGLIERMRAAAGKRLSVGAGTVLAKKDLKAALGAGASFIVMPTLERALVRTCVRRGIPVFPGAFTPGEVLEAWRAGATMVKVFPAKFFGPGYIKELKGPLDSVELMACGGVNPSNIKDFFTAGASAVAFGAGVFKKEWLRARDFESIENSIKHLISSCK
jgi:2-dehydro-3-deoxyphosphogluconate aldolase/(4S)-4-hydroxy-2-oxoglutarate aldolase